MMLVSAMPSSYDPFQVALSVLIAVAASYAALDLAGRVTAAQGRDRLAWLIGGATSMGIGIWAMHYVGMLAFRLRVPVSYYWPIVLLSLFIGILCSLFALVLVSRKRMSRGYALFGSVFMGTGIAGLHYVSMTAMRLTAVMRFDPIIVALSVLLAIAFSLAALWLAFYFRDESTGMVWRKVGSASLMGAAVSAMHYTGMAAASFLPSSSRPNLWHTVNISSLGTLGIGIVTLIVLGLAVLTCAVDRQLDAQKYQLSLAQSRMELAHMNRLATAGGLAASIAHEINQPLAAIAMNAGRSLHWLDIEPPNLPEARQAISRILKQANRANDIITGIRSMVAKSPPRTENVNMNDIIHDVLSLIGSELAKGRVIVRTELANDSPVVEGDRVQLQQVILNLLINAIEAMSHTRGRPRELIIRATKQDSRILVQVEDSGPGIDPAQADRMFQAFSTTKPQGLGMGLSISRSIIEAHGGHLSARSIDCRGAIFEVYLPTARGRT